MPKCEIQVLAEAERNCLSELCKIGNVEAERNGLSELCKIGNVIWEWDMVFEGKWDDNFKKDWESNGESKLMEMLGLKETAVQMEEVNGVRWYGHMLRKDDGLVLR